MVIVFNYPCIHPINKELALYLMEIRFYAVTRG